MKPLQRSAFIIASATDIAVGCVGAEGVVKYLHDLDDKLMVYDADEGAQRRATRAWRDCVVDGDYDIATRSALYSVGDLADSAAGLVGALDSALWMVVNVLDPARDDFEMPMKALGLLFDVVEMARDWS